MKQNIVLATIFLAAICIAIPLCIAAGGSDSADTGAGSPAPQASPLGELEEFELPTQIMENVTVPAGYYAVLKDNYVLHPGKWITFESGSELRFDASYSNSIVGLGGGGIFMKEGADVRIGIGLVNLWFDFTYDEDLELGLEGQFIYRLDIDSTSGYRVILTERILDTSEVTFNGYRISFIGDTGINADITATMKVGLSGLSLVSEIEDIKGSVSFNTGDIIFEKIDGSIGQWKMLDGSYSLYNIKYDTAETLKEDFNKFAITGNSTWRFILNGVNATHTSASDLELRINNSDDPTQIYPDLRGTANLQFTVDDMESEEYSLKGIYTNLSANFDENWNITTDSTVGKLRMHLMTLGGGLLTMDNIAVHNSVFLDFDSIKDFLSLDDLTKLYEFASERYDESMDVEYIKGYLGTQMAVYFADEPRAIELIDGLIERTPEPIRSLGGFICGFFLDVAEQKGIDFKTEFQKVYDGMSGEKGLIDYVRLCTDRMCEIVFDAKDYQKGVSHVKGTADIGDITYKDEETTVYMNKGKLDGGINGENGKHDFYLSTVVQNLNIRATNPLTGHKVSISHGMSTFDFSGDIVTAKTSFSTTGELVINVNGTHKVSLGSTGTDLSMSGERNREGIKFNSSARIDPLFGFVDDIQVNGSGINADLGFEMKFPTTSTSDLIKAVLDYIETGLIIPEDIFEALDLVRNFQKVLAEDMGVSIDDISTVVNESHSIDSFTLSDPSDVYGLSCIAIAGHKASFTYDIQGLKEKLESSGSLTSGYLSQDGETPMTVKVKYVSSDMTMTGTNKFRINGNVGYALLGTGSGSDIKYSAGMENANVTIIIDPSVLGIYYVESCDGTIFITDEGISLRASNLTYDKNAMSLKASEATLSGSSTNYDHWIYNVNGKVNDVVFSISDDSFVTVKANSADFGLSGFSDSDVKVKRDGKTLTIGVNNGEFCIVDLMANDLLAAILFDEVTNVTIEGDGIAFVYDYDLSSMPVNGTIYAVYSFVSPDLTLDLETAGCLFGFNNGSIVLKAAKGFTLLPDSFEGFTYSDGKVTVDSEIIEAGYGVLKASSAGKEVTVTLDGKPIQTSYGATIAANVPIDTIAIVDSKNNVYGEVNGGTWVYVCDVMSDISLTSIKAVMVEFVPDLTVDVDSEYIYFRFLGEDFKQVGFRFPSGVIVEFTRDDIMGTSLIYAGVVPLGNDRYDILSNVHSKLFVPVKDNTASLFHVVNDVDVPMMSSFESVADQLYAMTFLDSYSAYYVQYVAEKKDAGDSIPMYIVIGVIAVLAVGMLVVMSRKH